MRGAWIALGMLSVTLATGLAEPAETAPPSLADLLLDPASIATITPWPDGQPQVVPMREFAAFLGPEGGDVQGGQGVGLPSRTVRAALRWDSCASAHIGFFTWWGATPPLLEAEPAAVQTVLEPSLCGGWYGPTRSWARIRIAPGDAVLSMINIRCANAMLWHTEGAFPGTPPGPVCGYEGSGASRGVEAAGNGALAWVQIGWQIYGFIFVGEASTVAIDGDR